MIVYLLADKSTSIEKLHFDFFKSMDKFQELLPKVMYIAIVLELDQVTIDLPSVGQLIGIAVFFIIILWIGTND